uniref:Uncharacterized protein n=1 Tax=Scleropages formosus TaxID=113540 RepID=A0A8C9R8K3_SCLFO
MCTTIMVLTTLAVILRRRFYIGTSARNHLLSVDLRQSAVLTGVQCDSWT